jgi:hypothetical protein
MEKVRRGWRSIHFSRYHYNDQIAKNRVVYMYPTHTEMSSEDKKMPLKGLHHLGYLHIYERIILSQVCPLLGKRPQNKQL